MEVWRETKFKLANVKFSLLLAQVFLLFSGSESVLFTVKYLVGLTQIFWSGHSSNLKNCVHMSPPLPVIYTGNMQNAVKYYGKCTQLNITTAKKC